MLDSKICANEKCSNEFYPSTVLNIYCQLECRKEGSQRRKKRSHGLTDGQARKLKENKICEICGRDENLVVDHDHITMEIRGVLCNSCNSGLGMFKDSTMLLQLAIEYLQIEQRNIKIPSRGLALQGCGTPASWERGCRCNACSSAYWEHRAELDKKRLQEERFQHGTLNGYTLGCRCTLCKKSSQEYQKKRATKGSLS